MNKMRCLLGPCKKTDDVPSNNYHFMCSPVVFNLTFAGGAPKFNLLSGGAAK